MNDRPRNDAKMAAIPGGVAGIPVVVFAFALSGLFSSPASAQTRPTNEHPLVQRQVLESSPSRDDSRRRPTAPKAPPSEAPAKQSWYVVEKASADFGLVSPGQTAVIDGALLIRVFSEDAWILRLAPRVASVSSGSVTERISSSRLALKTGAAGWQVLRDGVPSVVARGKATSGAGELVILDLKLALENRDPVGYFGAELELRLDPR
ncbi:MAG: hypothetical protein KY459_13155 [Acidobacteria bacterium]|nr:hypothetical protein [Acidobacteriota bacterium]